MRAVLFRRFGEPSVLEVVKDYPVPKATKKGEVLVKIHATSVNPIDWKTRSGAVPRFAVSLPKVLGGDVAGVVEDASLAVGPGRRFRAGDRVYACTDGFLFYNKWGAYAEYMVVKEEQLAAIPEGLSFEEAGGVPLCALTAWQALEGAMPLAGKRVLVHAGAGGVGCFAVQIAKALGAHVTATCGSRNVEFVTQTLGADVAVDYSASDFEAPCRESAANKYDCVVDLIGGDYEIRSMRCLKPRGHYANVLNSGWLTKYPRSMLAATAALLYHTLKGKLLGALRLGPSYAFIAVSNPAARGLDQVSALISEGKVKPVVDRVLPLEQAAEAHAYMEQLHARGKVVLKIC